MTHADMIRETRGVYSTFCRVVRMTHACRIRETEDLQRGVFLDAGGAAG